MEADERKRVVVVGAGPCGLGIARQLRHHHGIDALVVDRADTPAAAWRHRYEGFRLNTCGFWSHSPGQRIPRRHGRWPNREDMIGYFDDYVQRQGLRLALGVSVNRIDRDGRSWRVATDGKPLTAEAVLIATGNYHTPMLPAWHGRETFTGRLLHSAEYRTAAPFTDCDVLVVGSGNSATDIAVQLSDGIARRVRMAVRSAPHLVPRSAAGVPIDAFSPLFSGLPVPLLDTAAKALQRLRFGDLSAKGLDRPRRGIYTELLQEERIPTIGDELVPRIKGGSIEIVPAVRSFDGSRVVLVDSTSIEPEIVIAATGYRRGLESLVGHLGVLDDSGRPVSNGLPSATTGLWFAGYEEPLIGPLRSFRRQASPIATDIARYLDAAN